MTQTQPSSESRTGVAPDAAASSVATALGRIPSGLFIVTWRADGCDRGMLASWVMQAGFAPPMVSVAVAPGRDLLGAVEGGEPFVVNVLADSQRALLARFGRPAGAGEDPFAGLAVGRAPCAAPTLGDAAAWLECRPVFRTAGSVEVPGDHVIVLARVLAAGVGPDGTPLVHLRKNGLRY